MSAYSDWKVWSLTDEEYKVSMTMECVEVEEHGCWDCNFSGDCDGENCIAEEDT